MGNIQSMTFSNILDNYTLVRDQQSIKIIQDRSSKKLYTLNQSYFNTKEQFTKYLRNISINKHLDNHEYIVSLVKYWSQEQKGLCSNSFKVYTLFQYLEINLSQQIQTRKKLKKYFKQQELISMISICINVFKSQNYQVKISPQLMFITQDGVLKLSHPLMLNQSPNQIFNSKYYYSPERFQNFEQISAKDSGKQKSFSIGLTILHAACLKNMSPCYQTSNKKFNFKLVYQGLQKITELQYSQDFIKLIKNLLEANPNDRWILQQVESYLEVYNHNKTVINYTFSQNQTAKQSHSRLKSELFENVKIQKISYFNDQNTKFQDINIHQQTYETYHHKKKQKEKRYQIFKYKQNFSGNQNIFTDPRILQIIKENKVSMQQSSRNIKDLENNIRNFKLQWNKLFDGSGKITKNNSTKDLFKQYQFLSSSPKTKQPNQNQSKAFDEAFMIYNGYGKHFYNNGVYYEGYFKDGAFEGKGSLFFGPNRPVYTGEWMNNQYHGEGTLYNQCPQLIQSQFDFKNFNKIGNYWIKYQGQFRDNKKEGQGQILLTNGQRINGIFVNDKISGQFNFTNIEGKSFKGLWNKNIFVKMLQ